MIKKLLFLAFLVPSICCGGVRTDALTVTGSTITINGVTYPPFGGGGGAFSDLSDVDDSARAINLVPKFNGSKIVWAAYNATFSFAVASFSDGLSSIIEIGSAGVWKSAGSISFTATYSNGPPTGSTVTFSGWGSGLPMTSSFLGPTASVSDVNYPSVAGTVVFTLSSAKASQSASSTVTHSFYNRRFWGVTTVTSGFSETDIEGLASNELSNSNAKTFTVAPGSGEYIAYSYPSRLGTTTFTVGGFEGGFNSPETVSVTNTSGYTENYYIYRSVNSNLGSTTVTAQ